MGCFGSSQTTKTQTTKLPAWLEDAAKTNISNAQSISSTPYQAYTGERYAQPNQNLQGAWTGIADLAGSQNPYSAQSAEAYTNAMNAGPSTVSTTRLVDDVPGANGSTAGGSTQDYMNPYIQGVLNPTLREIALQGAQQRLDLNKNLTTSGAFGDARAGIAEGLQRKNEAQNISDTTAKAWYDAFNTAMGLKSQDINRNLDVSKTNAAANETALNRSTANATNLTNLDKYDTGRAMDLFNALLGAGNQQQQMAQQGKDFDYQQFVESRDYPQQMAAFLSSIINGTPSSKTQTTSEPNNSGFGILGSLIGGAMTLSDERTKTDIEEIGETKDGIPIIAFRYKHDPRAKHIGFRAQDVEIVQPDAVQEVGGIKLVDYDKALSGARMLEAVV